MKKNNKNKTIAQKEMRCEATGVSALLLHQLDPHCYYAIFDDLKVSRAFKTLEELEKWLKALGYEEV